MYCIVSTLQYNIGHFMYSVRYCTAVYSTVQYSTVLEQSTVQYCKVQYRAYSTVEWSTVLQHSMTIGKRALHLRLATDSTLVRLPIAISQLAWTVLYSTVLYCIDCTVL